MTTETDCIAFFLGVQNLVDETDKHKQFSP